MTDFTQWTDDKLADEAQTGMRGQGAVIEMTRRLRESLVAQQEATNRLTERIGTLTVWLLGFTVALGLLTLVQIWLSWRV